MSTINLNVNLIDLDSKQLKALSNFVESFDKEQDTSVEGVQSPIVKTETEEAPKKTRAPRGSKVQAGAFEGQERTESVVDEHEAKAAELTVVEATDADDDLLGDSKPTYTQNDVREAMAKKIDKHRLAMKDKITALGASKFVDMDASKYPEFMEFLNSLS